MKKIKKLKLKKIITQQKPIELPVNTNTPIIPVVFRFSEDKRPKIIQAAYAEIGTRYVSHTYNDVLELVSKDTKDSGDIRTWKLVFKGYSHNGDLIELTTNGLYPLIIDPEQVNLIMEKYIRGVNIMAEKKGSKVKTSMDKNTGKIVKTGAPKNTSVAMDPKTGCRPGTTAHIIGEIMLSFKPGADHRHNSITKIIEVLEDQGFEPKKAKTLAASWYSTLILRKAHIYGKFKPTTTQAQKTAKQAKPVAAKKVIKKAKAAK